MKILVTGAEGQLGTELCNLLKEQQIQYTGVGIEELDITDKEAVATYFTAFKPNLVFHCAAYTAVDKAEEEAKELNYAVNVEGTRNIAEATEEANALLVFISTDYVFDGKAIDYQYKSDDLPNPLNQYGITKWEAEQIVANTLSAYYIIRTSWVFGKYGNNFVYTMLRLAETNPVLKVVDDQIGRPTWTRSLAEFMLYATLEKIPFGTYHFSNEGSCSWFEFAQEILKENSVQVEPIPTSQFPQKATRPMYSVMSLTKTEKTGFSNITWQEALQKMRK